MQEKRLSLFDIVSDALALAQDVADARGELSAELDAALAISATDLATKVDGYVIALKQFSVQSDFARARAREFTDAARAYDAAEERLKGNLKTALTALGAVEVSGAAWRLRLSESAKKLELEESRLPPQYLKAITTMVADKDRIRDDLAAGVEIPGARLVPVQTLRSYTAKKGE